MDLILAHNLLAACFFADEYDNIMMFCRRSNNAVSAYTETQHRRLYKPTPGTLQTKCLEKDQHRHALAVRTNFRANLKRGGGGDHHSSCCLTHHVSLTERVYKQSLIR